MLNPRWYLSLKAPSKSQSWVSNLPIAQKRSAWRAEGWSSLSQFTGEPSYANRMLSREFIISLDSLVSGLVMSTAEIRRSKSHCVGLQIEPARLRLNCRYKAHIFQKGKSQATRDAKGERKAAEECFNLTLRTRTRGLVCSNQTIRFDPISQTGEPCVFLPNHHRLSLYQPLGLRHTPRQWTTTVFSLPLGSQPPPEFMALPCLSGS